MCRWRLCKGSAGGGCARAGDVGAAWPEEPGRQESNSDPARHGLCYRSPTVPRRGGCGGGGGHRDGLRVRRRHHVVSDVRIADGARLPGSVQEVSRKCLGSVITSTPEVSRKCLGGVVAWAMPPGQRRSGPAGSPNVRFREGSEKVRGRAREAARQDPPLSPPPPAIGPAAICMRSSSCRPPQRGAVTNSPPSRRAARPVSVSAKPPAPPRATRAARRAALRGSPVDGVRDSEAEHQERLGRASAARVA